MKQRLVLIVKLFIVFFSFSIFSKLAFLIYHWKLTYESGFLNSVLTFWHGFRLDISASSYLILVPLVVLFISSIFKIKVYYSIIYWYTVILLFILSLILVIDLELYSYWGFRLDITSALYIKTPKEALASVSVWLIIRQLLLAALIFYFFYRFNKRFNKKQSSTEFSIIEIPFYLLLTGLLIIPIRGGVGIAPINAGSAYFSQNNFLNHASINVFWNLGNSIADNTRDENYDFYDKNTVQNLVKPYLNQMDSSGLKVIKVKSPNIILIMMESFTANVIESLGGIAGITPCLNKLSNEGILFTNFYASGDRSDKGLVSILSGFPAQPTFSAIKDAAKTQNLPKLPVDLKKQGYNVAFYYGGDLNFANMRSYLVTSGFSDLISKDDFPRNTYNSKWGAVDHVVFNKLMEDVDKSKSPFFKMFFTLSSHEPFEVPSKKIPGNDDASKFLNSVYYTDSCLGNFIREAKTRSWWKNTWVIIVADHGVRLPSHLKNHVPEKFRIPMLWIGGAIDTAFKVNKVTSQIDIPVTVLNQLGYNIQHYKYSRNIFGNSQATDAFYAYNDGVGLVNDTMKLVYDFNLSSILQRKGKISNTMINVSKAYIQTVYSDLKKK